MSVGSPAGIEIRPATAEEMPRLLATTERAFGDDSKPERAALEIAAMEPERTLAAFDGGAIVSGAGIYSFEMTVPGGPTPMAGVTWVGVLPTHRRRGILTTMMRRQLTELHEQEREPVAALWASEPVIYRRFGYGLASQRFRLKAESRLGFVPGAPESGRLRMVALAEARPLIKSIYERVRSERPGMISRSEAFWNLLLDDAEPRRGGSGSLTCAMTESGNGYTLYRTKSDYPDGLPAGKVSVREIMATDALAHASLWRYLLDMDLMTAVELWNAPLDDPLQHLVADVRRLRPALADALWVRVVDVERALAVRTYGADGSVVIDLVDDDCPWNTGRFRLDVETDSRQVAVTRTDETADISLSSVQLGAAFLGGTRLRALAAAGFVDEHSQGGVRRADAMFAGAVEPWCAEVF